MRIGFLALLLCQGTLAQAQLNPDTVQPANIMVNQSKPDTFRVPPPIRYSRQQLFVPVGLVVSGILTNANGDDAIKMEIKEMRNVNMRDFSTKIDNYLQYSPVVIAYGLDALGVKSRNPVIERSLILAKGAVLNYVTVNALKRVTRQLRPDETTYNSWPSGHTANAFAAATFLSEEYKHRFKWMPYAAYGLASTVGALRIANNRHYISDVLAGAGFGYLSMKVAYWTHQYRWSKKHRKSYPVF
ncbi:phosphatase PAP2 family protein [Chitinophaga horti]|uniref:Phosphatase PAP2 family protein n=1 Tax=Chitinophaga horti TaxID=2920382 RepID=A0ABY6J4M3_9BACT|nr:phosphatase PAP2 family protein [Chitinophaga horti]UYQ94543.1 phosphatase PAP2 family protein [Chitinophaga horti]